jgi:N-acetylglucosaminyldiphosphoundecaprenol N-acetyl-beta-D-mannosaminyltransferase
MNAPSAPRTVVILGVPFHDLTLDETVQEIGRLIARREPCYLATANLDFAAQASHDVELQRILLEAELVLCDGKPLVWASHEMGSPLRARVTGSDLVPRLAAEAAAQGWSLFFLGGEPAALELAMANLRNRHPGLKVAGFSPPFAPLLEMEHETIAARIKAARPDILLVAFGCPKQEKWIYMNYRRIGVPVSIGVGATVDFIAGKFRRAPGWMQAIGAEWIFRLAQEPRRLFSRYWFDLLFFIRATRHERRARRALGTPTPATAYAPAPNTTAVRVIAWPATVDASSIQAGNVPVPATTEPGQILALDLSAVNFLDSSGLGLIVKNFRLLSQRGGGLVLLRPTPPVRALLTTVRLDRVVPIVEDPGDARRALGLRPAAAPAPSSSPDALVLSLTGDLTASSVPSTIRWIQESWEMKPASLTLQLDMRAVNFVDSSGLGLLIRAHRLVQQRPSARLVLHGVNTNVRNVIRISKLEQLFQIHDGNT